MDKHTPGPWKLLDGMHARKTSNYDKSYRVAVLGPRDAVGNTPHVAYAVAAHAGEADANARLIAAAPEMRDLLQEIVGPYVPNGTLQKKIHALLAKLAPTP
jgi:hypothetical protein